MFSAPVITATMVVGAFLLPIADIVLDYHTWSSFGLFMSKSWVQIDVQDRTADTLARHL